MAEKDSSSEKRSGNKLKIVSFLVIFILVGIAGFSSYMFYESQQKVKELSTAQGQQQLAQKEIDALLADVKKLMDLPEKEMPTVATVTDATVLKKNQPFFEKAQNGDKVIVYVGAKKAIIYSPSRKVIVNVGFVAVDGNGQVAGANTATQPFTVEVRNGTTTAGLAQKIGTALKDIGATVTTVGDASKKNYEKTVIVATGKTDNEQMSSVLEQSFNVQVVKELPEGEASSAADFLIIVGADQK